MSDDRPIYTERSLRWFVAYAYASGRGIGLLEKQQFADWYQDARDYDAVEYREALEAWELGFHHKVDG